MDDIPHGCMHPGCKNLVAHYVACDHNSSACQDAYFYGICASHFAPSEDDCINAKTEGKNRMLCAQKHCNREMTECFPGKHVFSTCTSCGYMLGQARFLPTTNLNAEKQEQHVRNNAGAGALPNDVYVAFLHQCAATATSIAPHDPTENHTEDRPANKHAAASVAAERRATRAAPATPRAAAALKPAPPRAANPSPQPVANSMKTPPARSQITVYDTSSEDDSLPHTEPEADPLPSFPVPSGHNSFR